MKTYPKQKIGSRAYIGESMVKILICDDDQTFAQSMFKRDPIIAGLFQQIHEIELLN